MHNCKSTKDSLVELALNEISPADTRPLLVEVNGCSSCREEYAAISSALHVSTQALRSTLPPENFWPSYNQRLQARLDEHNGSRLPRVANSKSSGFWFALKSMLTSSVRIPVPAAVAILLVFVGAFFLLRIGGRTIPSPAMPPASIQTKIIEVPVTTEKVVTRVVYVAKPASRSRRPDFDFAATAPSAVAKVNRDAAAPALNLINFKPTEEVKLRVIKGSNKGEK